jgi:hypothetical protein
MKGVKILDPLQEVALVDTKINEVPSNMTFDHPEGLVITGGDQ